MIKVDFSAGDKIPALLLVLSATVFFVGFTEFMLSSMLSPLAEAFGTTPVGASWLVSSYAFSYALAAPLFGYFSDRANKRKLLLGAMLFSVLDGIAIIYSSTLEMAIALRVFGGIASAVLIPMVFSLLSDVIPASRQAGAMGVVMLGMTSGITLGPVLAGVLTDYLGWQAPFLFSSIGCLIIFTAGFFCLPEQPKPLSSRKMVANWYRNWEVLRPLIAKGAWNGTGVSAFLLSGEVLRERYEFGASEVGFTVIAFGAGLGLGNLSAGLVRQWCKHEEAVLIWAVVLLLASITVFMMCELSVWAAVSCLFVWGAALGVGAPLSTVILASRSTSDKGMVLACAETFNNVGILSILPVATSLLVVGGARLAMVVIFIGLMTGLVLSVVDFFVTGRRLL